MAKKLLIVQVAGLGHDFLCRHHGAAWQGLTFRPLESVFPALTCTAQAGFRTASPVSSHGMTANGLFHRDLNRPLFWEQSATLVAGPRIWESFRRRGKRVALLFWQQSLGEDVDILLSPAPIHKHGGGMVDSLYSKPAGLYDDLRRRVGRAFRLHDYWGPLASPRASDWIARATAALLADSRQAPDLCLTYLPALDYDLQRHGPDHPRSLKALTALIAQLNLLHAAAGQNGYDLLVFGDYAIGPVNQALFPNRVLREQGLFQTRQVAGRHYADFPASLAFALVDHEIAHVHIKPGIDPAAIKNALTGIGGIGAIMDSTAQESAGIRNPRGGELLLVAKPGYWFAYPWWSQRSEAPDYAGHVDIHNKPGYDPCELFFGWPPVSVSQDPSRIHGSHGRPGSDRLAAWASTCPLPTVPSTLLDLARSVSLLLESPS
jgi:predicted AlkP superfamily pyrophosphatase or phosphodiesterase